MKRVTLILLGVMLFWGMTAYAADPPDVWVTSTTPYADKDNDKDAIHWWYSEQERGYYLFLPACAGTRFRVHFTGLSSPTLDGTPLTNGETVSLSAVRTYTIMSGEKSYPLTVMRSSGAASLFMQTASGTLAFIHENKDNEEEGSLLMLSQSGEVIYDGALTQIRGRGNATLAYVKKPYQIKLDEKADLIGAGKSKTWLLLANHLDNSLLRNKITLDMADAAGLSYTSQSAFCDLYINHEYYGTYLLCEKVEIGNNRIEISDLEQQNESVNSADLSTYDRYGYRKYQAGKKKGWKLEGDPDDITGGYLLELEYESRYANELSGFVTRKGQAVVVKEPEYASVAQIDYISALVQSFDDAVRTADGVNRNTGAHYTSLISLDSFVLKYLVEEISKNFDGNKSSQFFYKPADSESTLLFAGPPWDYDSSYGNHFEGSPKAGTGEYFQICNSRQKSYYWYPALYKHEDFRKRVQELYVERFMPILEALVGRGGERSGVRSIAAYAQELSDSAAMNYTRWPVFNASGRKVKTGATYQENIEFLTNFLNVRLDFLNKQWLVPYEKGEVCEAP